MRHQWEGKRGRIHCHRCGAPRDAGDIIPTCSGDRVATRDVLKRLAAAVRALDAERLRRLLARDSRLAAEVPTSEPAKEGES